MSNVPQMFLAATPHASSQFAMGRCACPDGASLTTVGSVLVDAVGTLTAQSKGSFTAQTTAVLSWLSQSATQCHSQAKVEVFAGGGVAPGPCGAGAPATTPPATSPAASSEKMVNGLLMAANLGRGLSDLASAQGAAQTTAVVADMAKEVASFGANVAPPSAQGAVGKGAGVLEAVSGVAQMASGDVVGGLAALGAGVAGASGAGADLEERAATEIKMVAGKKISGTAGVGIDYLTTNKFSVTAALLTDFTTIKWAAFCLLKYEVKSFGKVKVSTGAFTAKATTSASMDGTAKLTFKASHIRYDADMQMTNTLLVVKETSLHDILTVKGDSLLQAKLDVKNNLTVKQTVEIKANAQINGKLTTKQRTRINGELTQIAKATLA